jgi:hypothetical protein
LQELTCKNKIKPPNEIPLAMEQANRPTNNNSGTLTQIATVENVDPRKLTIFAPSNDSKLTYFI